MRKRLFFLFTALFLTGCSTTSLLVFSPDHVPTQWQFNGKVAIKTPEQAQGLKINWHQIDDQFDINLYTTFGITDLKIKGNKHTVNIESDQGPITGTSAQQLIWQQTGWHIPIDNLQHWLLGDVTDATNVELSNNGHFLSGNIYDNFGRQWQLSLNKYQPVQGRTLPHSLRLRHDKLLLKLAIIEWKIEQ